MRRSAVVAASVALVCGAGGVVAAAAPAAAAAWRNIPSQGLGYDGTLDKVDVVNKQLAWAVGRTRNGQTKILRWGGRGWNLQRTPVNFIPTDVAGAGPRRAWAVGLGPGLSTAVHWNGTRWVRVGGFPMFHVPAAVSAAPDGTAYSLAVINAGNGGPSQVLRWNGRAFARVNVPLPPSTSITALDVRAWNNVWLAGATSPTGTQVLGIVLHYDGRTWRRIMLPGAMGIPAQQGVLHKIVAPAPNNVYVSRVAQQAQIPNSLMHWNGQRWREIRTPLNAVGVALTVDGAGGAWVTTVATGNRARYLHWNRTAWTTVLGPVRGGAVTLGDLDNIPGTRGAFSVGSFPRGNTTAPIIERLS